MSDTAVLVTSDWHMGKLTKSFNPDVLGQRLKTLSQTLNRIPEQGTSYDRLVPLILGDFNDGTLIYATQTHEQAMSNVEKQADMVSDMAVDFIAELRKAWTIDEIVVCAGNHGRTAGAHVAANWDLVAYRYLQLKLKGSGPGVRMPTEDMGPFFNKVSVRGHRFLLHHGNSVDMYQQIPWYGMVQKALKWNASSMGPFDSVLYGHFHTPGYQRINKLGLYITGSAVSNDNWSLTKLGLESDPCWLLLTVNGDGRITECKYLPLN